LRHALLPNVSPVRNDTEAKEISNLIARDHSYVPCVDLNVPRSFLEIVFDDFDFIDVFDCLDNVNALITQVYGPAHHGVRRHILKVQFTLDFDKG